MALWDPYVRAFAAALVCLLIIFFCAAARRNLAAFCGVFLGVGILGFLIVNGITPTPLPNSLLTLASIASQMTVIFIWWFSLSMFDDDFQLGAFELSLSGVWALLVLAIEFPRDAWIPIALSSGVARNLIALGLVIFIVVRIAHGRASDLVEPRRKARMIIIAVILAVLSANLLIDLATGQARIDGVAFFENLAVLGAALSGCIFLLRLAPDAGLFNLHRPNTTAPKEQTQSPNRNGLLQKLEEAIEQEIYLDTELSLRSLAEKLNAGTPGTTIDQSPSRISELPRLCEQISRCEGV